MMVRIDERKFGVGTSFSPLRSVAGAENSPKLRGLPEEKEQPLKFSLTLMKKEIEENFMNLTRRPFSLISGCPRLVLIATRFLMNLRLTKVALMLAKGILMLAAKDAYEDDRGFHRWMELVVFPRSNGWMGERSSSKTMSKEHSCCSSTCNVWMKENCNVCPPICHCGLRCAMRTAKILKNRGKLLFIQSGAEEGGCNYFKWFTDVAEEERGTSLKSEGKQERLLHSEEMDSNRKMLVKLEKSFLVVQKWMKLSSISMKMRLV
ncbi:hypothetical protein V8G54_002636 [Vigna mungo]|uniref:GRF-type domain-containing protein n=1 Tax=Vigna mungo TaxID=3915 RepID=A0AAQ3SB01_VIGMU